MTRKKVFKIKGRGDFPPIVLEGLDDFVDFAANVCYSPGFFVVLRRAAKDGKFDRWLRSMGETEFADILLRFKGEERMYSDAVPIIHETLKKAKSGFERVVGYQNAMALLKERAVYPQKFKEISRKYRKGSSGAMLLYGPPGCGKTALADALAGETKKFFVKKSVLEVAGSPMALKNTFNVIRRLGDSVLFIDEIEALAIDREYEGMNSRMFANALLTEINSSEENRGLVVIGATNTPWHIDSAMLRSGRFDSLQYIGVPDKKTRIELFRFYTNGMPLGKIDFNNLAEKTDFYSCSDIMALCQEAASFPWREALEGKKPRGLEQGDFDLALKAMPSTAVPWFEDVMDSVPRDMVETRFRPMLSEIERYRKTRKNLKWGGSYV